MTLGMFIQSGQQPCLAGDLRRSASYVCSPGPVFGFVG